MHNNAIERIAAPDLATDALALLKEYRDNDDVIFFLGRLVWQGEMTTCAPALFDIAADSSRGKYARIAAIRGVMAVGGEALTDKLLNTIAADPGPLDRAVFSELVDWAAPTMASVALLLRTLAHVAPHERFSGTGLSYSLHQFVDKLPLMADAAENHPLGQLVEGLAGFLDREPFVERGECHVSEEYMWLMPVALHAVDRLVAARSLQALTPAAIAVLCKLPTLQFWRSGDVNDYKNALDKNVPRWPELNDLLYWKSIEECRAHRAAKGETLTDDWPIAYLGHFWRFGAEDFERCLEWVATKELDDRAVALSRCIRIYVDADRPSAWLAPLRAAVADDAALAATLEARLDPKPSPAMVKMDAENRRWMHESETRERKEKEDRRDWVRALMANPDRVLHPAGLQPGEFSSDQYHLLASVMSGGVTTSREDGANWRKLIPEFGEPVAHAFRDAAIAHWRAYRPTLRSEGAETGSTPYSLIFAMTGLAIEAAEDSAFAQRLSEEEARNAFRYVTWELNGFPDWFETLYRAFPKAGFDAVATELVWELENSVGEHPLHYILHDILYYAPWLHGDVSQLILDWLGTHDVLNADALHYCLNILAGSSAVPDVLGALAEKKATDAALEDQRPRWFALWADINPAAAVPALERHLEVLAPADASSFAQLFIVALLGDRHGTGTRVGAYRNAGDLKRLYVLMHRYIRTDEDIDRIGKGVYSPTLRDNAQGGRDTLFSMLVEVPGSEAYAAIKALEQEHPESAYRRWMAVQARERATRDADEPLWTVEQVRDFSKKGDI
ncbi:hypothetical protein [Burkholderia sp. B21-007]|uniref:hypothetical protein n=1 Tax=Burkholderia sp. B21-007 TaxID=2890407 RepID=UPI001E2BA59D|nr:hypothetical protein [Burkholderia sp. B21-007]UEP27177.1 hypothetical protein LMA01_12825 [Burkholderia sp. B21-007]